MTAELREHIRVMVGTRRYEYDVAYDVTLVDHDAIESLDHVWAGFCRNASQGGNDANRDGRNDERRAAPDRRAVQTWENEGGRCADPVKK